MTIFVIENYFRHVIEITMLRQCTAGSSAPVSLQMSWTFSQSQGDNEEAEIARKESALIMAREILCGTIKPIVSEGEENLNREFLSALWLHLYSP